VKCILGQAPSWIEVLLMVLVAGAASYRRKRAFSTHFLHCIRIPSSQKQILKD
jgi:hypothetical protein